MAKKKKVEHFRRDDLRNWLTVDPGDNTGWAFWENTLTREQSLLPDTGVITLPRKMHQDTLENQLWYMFNAFHNLLDDNHHKMEGVILEGVELWSGSEVSMVSGFKGDLMKLSYLVGGYMEICRSFEIPVHLVYARLWKGQMNNATHLVQRVAMANHQQYKNEHIRCAVGIGLSVMGLL